MVEAGAKEVTEEQVVEALERGARGHQADRGRDRRPGEGSRQEEAGGREEGDRHDFYREIEDKVLVPLTEAMRIRGKLENYEPVDLTLEESGRVAAGKRSPSGRSTPRRSSRN